MRSERIPSTCFQVIPISIAQAYTSYRDFLEPRGIPRGIPKCHRSPGRMARSIGSRKPGRNAASLFSPGPPRAGIHGADLCIRIIGQMAPSFISVTLKYYGIRFPVSFRVYF